MGDFVASIQVPWCGNTEALESYLLNQLDEKLVGDFEAHLLLCQSCLELAMEQADFLVELQGALDHLLGPPAYDPSYLEDSSVRLRVQD